eukprot:TRINITY_DN253_c0_g1_i4.p1 TRINITY_DN253_c0_g1~~TRINITY_DN253_c0_g1_i4.p1  ORF type:complete len:455 (-),score=139.25 TRINITY_DN253_c0_g1_i4:66-1430(-)
MMHKSIIIALCFCAFVIGHTTLTSVTVNGQKRTDCLRPTYDDRYYSQTGVGSTYPMSDEFTFPNGIEGENYTCGWMPFAATAASTKCAISAGSSMTVTHTNPFEPNIPYLAANHRGPFMAYMSRWEQNGGVPTAKTWFKVYQSGIIEGNSDPEKVKWAGPDTLVANQGGITFQIPSDLAPGNYLLRTEILSFLSSNRRGAQGYIRCVELTVTGNGKSQPSGDYLAQLPGSVTYNDPGIRGIWWSDYAKEYPFPGPQVYTAGSQTTASPTPSTSTPTSNPPTSKPTPTVPTSTPTVPTGNEIPLEVLVTVTIQVAPSSLKVQTFASDITGVLAIPVSAITNVRVNLDRSTDATTVVDFILNNAVKPDGSRVDPIAAAYKLREMANNKDPQLAGTVYLANMQVNEVDEQQAGSAEVDFVNSSTFIIIIAVIGGLVLISIVVVVAIVLVRRKRNSFY